MVTNREELSVVLSLKDAFSRQLIQPIKKMETLGRGFSTLGKSAKIAGAAVVASFALMSREILKTSASLVQLNKATGFSIERLQALGVAAEFSNSSMQAIQVGVRTLARAADEAAQGVAEYKDEFDRLGVSVLDNEGNMRNLESVFDDVIEALGKVENKTSQVAGAQILLGRSGSNLLPLIEGGKKGLDDVAKVAEDLGIIMKKDTVEALEVFGNQMNVLKQSGRRLVSEGLLVIANSLPELVDGFFAFIEVINRAKNEITLWAKDAVSTFEFVKDAFQETVKSYKKFGAILAIEFSNMTEQQKAMAKAALDATIKTKGIEGAIKDLQLAGEKNRESTKEANEETIRDLDRLRIKIQEALALVKGDGGSNLAEGFKESATAAERLANAFSKMDKETRKASAAFELHKDEGRRLKEQYDAINKVVEEHIALAVKDGEVTAEEADQIFHLRQQLESAKFSLDEYDKKLKEQDEKGKDKFKKTEVELSELEVAVMDLSVTMENSLAGAFDRVLLEGESFTDSMKNFFNEILRSFVQMGTKMAASKIIQAAFGGGGNNNAPGGTDAAAALASTTGQGQGNQASGFSLGGVGAQQAAQAQQGGGGGGFNLGGLGFAAAGIGAGITMQQIERGNTTGAVAGGAFTGAMMGMSVAGPWGAAVGLVVGAAAGAFGARDEKKKQQKAKEQQAAAIAAQEAEIRRRREEAAKAIKENLVTNFGGGLATRSGAGEVADLFEGDVTVDDVIALEEKARQQQIAQQAGQLAGQTVNVGAPQVSVSVGSISGAYDAQNLGQDIGRGINQGINDAAASV